MANRTVSVALVLEAGRFKTETLAAAKSVDHLDGKVESLDRDITKLEGAALLGARAVDHLGDEVKDLDRSITKVPPDATRAALSMQLLGASVDDVGDKIGSLGEKSTQLHVLDARIRTSRAEVRKLADEFARTGDLDLFKRLGDSEGRLRSLTAARKSLAASLAAGAEDAGKVVGHTLVKSAADAGPEAGKIFSGGLTGALSTPVLGPLVGGALVAGIAAEIPLVLSAIGGAVLGAGALGAVGAGIGGALLGDPHDIAESWEGEIEKLKTQWVNASRSFKSPLIDGAHEFGRAMAEVHIDVALQKAATYLPELIRGAAGLATHLGKGIGVLTDSAGPVMKVIASELPKIGMAFEAAFTSIGRGSEGGATALKDLLQFTERVIVAVGRLIEFGEKAYGTLAKFRDLVIPRSWLFSPDGAEGIHGTARALVDFSDGADSAKWAALSLGDAITSGIIPALNDLNDRALGMADANLALRQGFLDLQKELETGKRVLGENTQESLNNEKAILRQVEAAERARQKTFEQTHDLAAANAVYEQSIATIRAMALALGFDAKKVDELIASLRGVPPTTTATVKTPGLVEAGAAAAGLAAKLNGLDGRQVDVYFAYHTRGQALNPGLAHGGIRGANDLGGKVPLHAATGMIVPPSSPGTLIGEPQTGGEALIPLEGISKQRAMDLAGVVGAAYGFDVGARQRPGYADLARGGSGGGGGRIEHVHRLIVQTQNGEELMNTILAHGGGGSMKLAQGLHHMQRTGMLEFVRKSY
jgi:hypothetical protein